MIERRESNNTSLADRSDVGDGISSTLKEHIISKVAVEAASRATVGKNASHVAGLGSPVNEVRSAIYRFAEWLDKCGYASYDPYDVWGTRYGRAARRLYYKKNPIGFILTAPLICMEIISPRLRGFFVRKDRYPTAEAQLALAFLNLYEDGKKKQSLSSDRGTDTDRDLAPDAWLEKAKNLADELLLQSVPGYKGYCWGYPFDWQNVHGLIPKGTPHITATPYCYEVFTRLFDLTDDGRYLDIARSIMDFVYEDLTDTPTGSDSAASSYTPHDHTKVINASAYRSFLLFDAARRFREDSFREKAWKNLRFILENQKADGSWLYAIDSPREAFIDNFHTCFVLKNLYKINRDLQSPDVRQAIRRGYEWYRKALFDEHDNPKTFAIAPRLQIVRLEMYNIAEAITLGAKLKDEIPGAFALAEALASRLIRCYSLPAGHWVTRVYLGGFKHTVPFLRWPQSQLFLSLSNLLVTSDD